MSRLGFLQLGWLLPMAALAVVAVPGTAHPVHMDCDNFFEFWGEAYANQLDPTDPESVTSGVMCFDGDNFHVGECQERPTDIICH